MVVSIGMGYRYELQVFHQFFNEHAENMEIVEEFEEKLKNSLSLNREEKIRVITEYPNLSEFQLRQLIEVFDDGEKKIKDIAEKNLSELQPLINKAQVEWEMILNEL
jgi:hypothetical protein